MADNEQSTPPAATSEPVQGVYSKPSRRHTRRRTLVIIVVVVSLLIAVAVCWWVRQRSSSDEAGKQTGSQLVFSNVCTAAIIREASPAIGKNDIAAVRMVAEKILQLPNYQGDTNCNYILERYYIMTGNIDMAKQTMSDLKQTYAHSAGYSTAFDPPAISLDSLQQSINVMVEQQQSAAEQSARINEMEP